LSASHIIYCLVSLYAKNYQIWWRFDKVLTKTSWVSFLAHLVGQSKVGHFIFICYAV